MPEGSFAACPQYPQGDLFAVENPDGGGPQRDIAQRTCQRESTVLGAAAFGDIHGGGDFDDIDDAGGKFEVKFFDDTQRTIHPEPEKTEIAVFGVEEDIACMKRKSFGKDAPQIVDRFGFGTVGTFLKNRFSGVVQQFRKHLFFAFLLLFDLAVETALELNKQIDQRSRCK